MPVGGGGGGYGRRKNRETVTASLCLVFKGSGQKFEGRHAGKHWPDLHSVSAD